LTAQSADEPAIYVPKEGVRMANTLQGKRVAILAADGVERVELETPREAVQDAGGGDRTVVIEGG
jgi:protease I